jgi:hypothetical protein
MNLCGEKVKHKIFGIGKIMRFEKESVIVFFDKNQEEKHFKYPSAFGSFLVLVNPNKSVQIDNDKIDEVRREADKKTVISERIKMEVIRKKDIKSLKQTNNSKGSGPSNIAFKCNFCDGGADTENVGFMGVCSEENIRYNISDAKHVWCSCDESPCNQFMIENLSKKELHDEVNNGGFVCYESQMLTQWRAFAGITQSGVNKGKPMKLRNVKSNSLAVLTTRLPFEKDNERFIFAVFLIDENYEGDNSEEGFVSAHAEYRIKLSKDESSKLKFWDYYFNPNKPEKIVLGSGLHRYLTDDQSAQILKKIMEIKKGKSDEELSKKMFEFYCKIKNLNIENLPEPNGALKRAILS